MLKAVLLQAGVAGLVALIAGLLAGTHGAVSAALGGAAVFIPNLLFVLRLAASRAAGTPQPAGFLMGEFVKVALTVALLMAVGHWYRDIHWLSFLAGLIVAVQSNLFALLMKI